MLLYIIEHCNRIESKVYVTTRENLEQDKDTEEIICFNILQIGELAKGLSQEFTSFYNKMPWKSIKGMRDKVAHGYGKIDLDEVWKTASEEIKPLREYCEEIIRNN